MASTSSTPAAAAAPAIDAAEEDRQLVEDKQSRAAAAWGKEAVLALKNAKYIVSGLSGVGVEAAKNIVLTRIHSLVLHDTKATEWSDLSAQFYLSEHDVGKNRAEASYPKVKELNPAVDVSYETGDLLEFLKKKENLKLNGQSAFDCLVICDGHLNEDLLALADWCHEKHLKLLLAIGRGAFGMLFADFGHGYVSKDLNGEDYNELPVLLIERVPVQKDGQVVGYEGVVKIRVADEIFSHGLQDGDFVTFSGLLGMEGLEVGDHQIRVIDRTTFSIGDVSHVEGEHRGKGFVRGIKKPVPFDFRPLRDVLGNPGKLVQSDLMKSFSNSGENLHFGFLALAHFAQQHNGRLPRPGNKEDAAAVLAKAEQLFAATRVELVPGAAVMPIRTEALPLEELNRELITKLALYAAGNLNPLASIIGALVAQEAQKAVTQKYTPLHQLMYLDFVEALPDEPLPEAELAPLNCRYDGQIAVFGRTAQERILNQRLFMVGCGALGCEYAKDFAMMGACCGPNGLLTVTDMDTVELSNLNRQFLFRQEHVGKYKSAAGTEQVVKMNADIKTVSLQKMVAPATEDVFDREFWLRQDMIVNALDNIQARLYVDNRCVQFHKILVEAGTEAVKCNCCIVVPDFSVNYGFHREIDPPKAKKCTISNFPYLIEHCIQFSRENTFQFNFVDAPDAAAELRKDRAAFMAKLDKMEETDRVELAKKLDAVFGANSFCATFEDAVAWARNLFESEFVHSPLQWAIYYPENAVAADGSPFWSGTKTFPTPQPFNPKNPLHVQFVATAAALRCKTLGIATPFKRLDRGEGLAAVLALAERVHVRPFVPKTLAKKASGSGGDDSEDVQASVDVDPARVFASLPEHVPEGVRGDEFEKDDDSNGHVDFIHACSNIRAAIYKVPQVDRLKTKLIAGRVIPAIVTSTALICGYAAFEMLKLWTGRPNSAIRETTVNLGTLMFTVQEPLEAPKWSYEGPEGVKNNFTLWSSINVDARGLTLGQFLAKMEAEYHLNIESISVVDEQKAVYNFLMAMRDKGINNKPLADLVQATVDRYHLKLDRSGVTEFLVSAPDGTSYKKETVDPETGLVTTYDESGPEHLPKLFVQWK